MNKQDELSFSGIVRHAWRYRFTLTLITVAATVVTYGITFLITPEFKTTAVIYPTAPVNTAKGLLDETSGSEGLSEFGTEDEAEQLMEVVSGINLRRKVADRLDLWNHFKINKVDHKKNYYFDILWEKNISLSLTKFNALRIEVYDTDPQVSASIANAIAEEADSAYRTARKERAIATHNVIKATKQLVFQEYNNLTDSLKHYRKLGILDIENQVKELYRVKAQDVAAGNRKRVNRIEKELETLKFNSAKVYGLERRVSLKIDELQSIEQNEKVAMLEAMQAIPSIFSIDKAEVPEVKAYPRRAIASIGAGVGAFLLCLFILLLKSYLANEVFIIGKPNNKQ